MPSIVKVCGITRPSDAVTAVEAGATAIGMIFYPKSPRAVRLAQAAMISSVTSAPTLKVGVFVNEDPNRIRTIVDAARLDIVQLHGDEGPREIAELDGLRVWKAVRVDEGFDATALRQYSVEAFLLDAPTAAYGGSGEVFPWGKAIEAKRYGKVIVAGGLAADNVAEAIREVDPWGVDASSRLESAPGVKDTAKVQAYVAAALDRPSSD